MAVDSLPTFAGAAALFAAGIAAWRLAAALKNAARPYLRFAAMLLAALAAAALLGAVVPAVTAIRDMAALFLLPLAGASLALAALARFAHTPPPLLASLFLVAALAGGLGASLTGMMLLALLPVVIASLAIVAAALGAFAIIPALAGSALLASALLLLEQGAGPGLLLFSAAALIGLARGNSTLAVDQQRLAQRRAAIGGPGQNMGLAPLGHRLTQDLRNE